jgi:iron complex transport system substrate-binding protein
VQPLGKDRIFADGSEIVRRNPGHRDRLLVRQEVPAEKVAARAGWER